MKIYILTQTCEDGNLAKAKAYKSLKEAQDAMDLQASAEYMEYSEGGMYDDAYINRNETGCAVGNCDTCYIWQITEDEV